MGAVERDAGLRVLSEDDERKGDVASLRLVLESLRRVADDQTKRIELARSSTRQLFVYTAGVFTVAQTIAGAALAATPAPSPKTAGWIIGLAISGAVLLVAIGVTAMWVDSLSKIKITVPGHVVAAYTGADDLDTEAGTLRGLIKLEEETFGERAAILASRTKPLRLVTVGATAAFGAISAEVVVSLLSRT